MNFLTQKVDIAVDKNTGGTHAYPHTHDTHTHAHTHTHTHTQTDIILTRKIVTYVMASYTCVASHFNNAV